MVLMLVLVLTLGFWVGRGYSLGVVGEEEELQQMTLLNNITLTKI